MIADDLRALSGAATPGPWDVVYRLCPEDEELVLLLRNHADALADLIDAAEDANICKDIDHCSMCRTLVDTLAALGGNRG